MARTHRSAQEHRTTAREAGLGRVSLVSIVAGTLCAYGAFAVVAAIAGSLLAAFDVDTEFRTNDWTSSGAVAGLVSGLVLLVAYLFGGYVAGRMARRSGLLHGLAVALLSLVLGAIVGGVAGAAQDSGSIQDDLRGVGVPTGWDQLKGVAIASVVVSLVAIVVGGILGGVRGERWHTRLATRAADPERGPAADARVAAERDRERAQRLDREYDERVATDPVIAHDVAAQRERSDHPVVPHDAGLR
ncbi:MAG TPA: TIGR04086 family membrane protein [Iamia sp.]